MKTITIKLISGMLDEKFKVLYNRLNILEKMRPNWSKENEKEYGDICAQIDIVVRASEDFENHNWN